MDTHLVGKEVGGKYRLVRLIGGGGMALVYEAHHLQSGTRWAVKCLRDQYVDDHRFVRRFHAEARAAAALVHPNLVPVHDVGQDGRLHYIVMEYVEGETLDQHVERFHSGPTSVQAAVRIAADIAATLEFVHHKGFIHRDVKPQNVMITPQGAVKLMDLGIAKGAASTSLTEKSVVLGSAAYSSPEQLRGEKVTAQSDIYSLGVTLFEMLTGCLPIESHTQQGWWYQHAHTPPPPPSQYNHAVPAWLDAIVLRALAKAPEERFSSAAQMQLALTGGEGNPRRSGEWTAPLPAAGPTPAVAPVTEQVTALPGLDPRAARGDAAIYFPPADQARPFVLRLGPWKIVLSGPFWWALRAWLHGPLPRRLALSAGAVSLSILLVLGVVGIIQGGVLPLPGAPGSPATASPTGQFAAASTATPADGGTDGVRGQAAPEITLIPTAAATDQPPHTPIPIPTTDLPGTAAAQHATATTLAAAAAARTASAISAETGTAVASSATHEVALAGTATQAATETAAAIAVAEDEARRSLTAGAATAEANNGLATALAGTATQQAQETASAVAIVTRHAAERAAAAETAAAVAVATRQAAAVATAVAATSIAAQSATAERIAEDATATALSMQIEAQLTATGIAVGTAAAGAAATATAARVPTFSTVSIQQLADKPMPETNLGLPPGRNILLGVPFENGWTASTQSAERSHQDPQIRVDVRFARPLTVYLLYQAGWGWNTFAGKQIGEVVLEFADGSTERLDLTMGENIRDWAIDSEDAVTYVTSPDVREAHAGTTDGGRRGRMDMLTLRISAELRDKPLTAIIVRDTSSSTAGSLDPAIHLDAVTVEHLP